MGDDTGYTLQELCERADVTARTVRYYIQQGLLSAPGRSGPGVVYPESHLLRLRLVRQLQDSQRFSLSEIRLQLETLSDDEVQAAMTTVSREKPETAADYLDRLITTPPTPRPTARTATPRPRYTQLPTTAQWERIVVHPDVEIHVRAPLSRTARRRLAKLIAMARALFEEERDP